MGSTMGKSAKAQQALLGHEEKQNGYLPVHDSPEEKAEKQKQDELAFRAVASTFTIYTLVDLWLTGYAFYRAHELQQGKVVPPMGSAGFHVAVWTFLGCLFAVDTALQSKLAWMARDYLVHHCNDTKQVASYSLKMHIFSIMMMFVYQALVIMTSNKWKVALGMLLIGTVVRLSKLIPLWKLRICMEAANRDGNYEVMHREFIAKTDPRWAEFWKKLTRMFWILFACVICGKAILLAMRPNNHLSNGIHGPVDTGANSTVINLYDGIDDLSEMFLTGPNPMMPIDLHSGHCSDHVFGGTGAGCTVGGTLTFWAGDVGAPIGCVVGGIGGWLTC